MTAMAATKPQRPPGPSPLRGARAIRSEPLEFLSSVVREYGDVTNFRVGPADAFVFAHPVGVKAVLATHGRDFMKGQALQEAKRILGEGLLTSEGEFHKRQRRLIQPIFHHERIAGYADTMAGYSERSSDRWRHGETRDVHAEMVQLTMAIVGKTLFDTDVEAADARHVGESLSTAIEMFDRVARPLSGVMERLPLPSTRRFERARGALDSLIYRLIAERRATGATGGDVLSLLLQAQDEEGDATGMTDSQVRDEAMTLFLAGHETTANALTWTWYLLSQNPEAEARMHAEVDEVLGPDRLPAAGDVERLAYTRTVLAESMRLYPPAFVIGRRALRDVQIGEWTVPKNSIAVVSQWVTHRDERWWPVPERFDPEHFAPGAEDARPRYAYFPFGAGSRMCIGESFAWMEGVLALATIARRWRMRLEPGHPVELAPMITLRPKNGMRMILERRDGG